jgi:carbon storage regulator
LLLDEQNPLDEHARDGVQSYILAAEQHTRRFFMLVLSRKEAQRIRLGDSIIVTVVRVSGDKVRLGIEAPPDVLVLRDELEMQPPLPARPQPLAPEEAAAPRVA